MLQDTNKKFVVGFGTTITSNISGWVHQSHNHYEADTLLICMLKELNSLDGQQQIMGIISPDTDVLMLALHLSAKEMSIKFLFELLNSKSKREIDVTSVIDHLGRPKSLGIIGAYISRYRLRSNCQI